MVEASSKLKLLILFCCYFSGEHVLAWDSSSPAEAFSSVRLCIVCAIVYVQNIDPVDTDFFGYITPVFLATRVLTLEHCNSSDASSPVGAVCSFVLLLLPLERNTCLLSNVTVLSHTLGLPH